MSLRFKNQSVEFRANLCDAGTKNFAFCVFVRRILVKNLELYPYRIQIRHQLTETDMEKRVLMRQWFSEEIDDNEELLNDVRFCF